MSRSTSRRSSSVQAEKSLPATSPRTEQNAEERASTPASTKGIPWTWRVVGFLWLTSLVFLFLYEWVAALVKGWHR